jgi:tRNA U34 2-thiouridine synthase MnmA/TrmU
MITQEMKQAMSTLSTFSEKDQQYYQYQARQEYLREQRTIQSELEQANKREEAARNREEAANKREALALAEIERLKALLAQTVLPDSKQQNT